MKQMVKVSQNHGWTECPPNDNCGPANGSSVVWVTETEEVVSMDTEPAFTGRLDGQIKVPGSIDGVSTFIKDKSQSIRFLNGKTIDDYRRYVADFLNPFTIRPEFSDPYTMVCKLVNQPFPNDLRNLDWTQTAIIIMDVWDRHEDPGDAMRTDELAAPINEFIKRARGKGALIIHSPSVMGGRYEGTPARNKAIEARNQTAKDPLWNRNGYYYLGKLHEEFFDLIVGGGGDWLPPGAVVTNQGAPTRQHPAIDIAPGDALSADGTGDGSGNAFQEVLALTKDRPYLVYVGTNTNWCVLRRWNGMRTMYKAGKSLWIVKDLTDAAVEGSASGLTDYARSLTADQAPPGTKLQGLQLNHFQLTELIVDWIGWNLHAATQTSDSAFPDLPRFWFKYDPDSPAERTKAKYYILNKKYPRYGPTAPISLGNDGFGNGYFQSIDQNAHLQPAGATVCQWTLKKIADGRAPASGCAYFEVLNVAHPASGIVGPEDINVDGGSSISTQPPMWPPGNERANARWLIPIDANGNPLTQKYFKVSNQKFTDHAMIAPHNKDSDGGEYVYFQKPSSSNPTTGEDYEFWLLVPA